MRIPFVFIAFLLLSVYGCKEVSYQDSNPDVTVKTDTTQNASSGQLLAAQYCSSCHRIPAPSALDQSTWKNIVLPRMGYMLGIFPDSIPRSTLFEAGSGGERVKASGLFPEQPVIADSLWTDLVAYYINHAPKVLPPAISRDSIGITNLFKVTAPQLKVGVPSTTMAVFSKQGTVYVGDANTKSFSEFDKDLSLLRTATLEEGVVSIYEDSKAYWLTSMGGFSPTDAARGSIIKISKQQGVMAQKIIKDLQRPVHASYADLNADGKLDVVVSEFGKWTGALSLHMSSSKGYQRQVLHNEPGAIKAYFKDMNNNGLLDIVALHAQGNEGIDIHFNNGDGSFKRERVVSLPATMGTSFMQLIDYNQDGYVDLLFTAGDNADYKPILKPWHGIYIYVNDGNNRFVQNEFVPLNGAYNAVVQDFDKDGDLDIAAISFFPDWENQPRESFVLFTKENNSFTPTTISQVALGRWVVMDSSDFDKDGDTDLVIGSLAFQTIPDLGQVENWKASGVPFLLLENSTH